MSSFKSSAGMKGSFSAQKHKTIEKAPLSWKIKNFRNLLRAWKVPLALALTLPTYYGTLRILLNKADGCIIDYGLVSARLVTTDFCEFIAAEMITETSAFGDFKYHDSGIGTTAADIANEDIETTDAESRATGSQVQGASAVGYKSIGTITYHTSKAITEHGLFNVSSSFPVLMDRHVFAAINVVDDDSITFTYELTLVAGG
jgi:hypothetical protein